MIISTATPLGRLQLLQAAGGCLQHAKGLLCSLLAAAEQQAAGGSRQNSSNTASGRSISTTRGIYMGRVFIRENLVQSATPSTLYTRDNYQFLQQNKWSLGACEQVLSNHHEARQGRNPQERPAFDHVNRALNERIRQTTSLPELRQVVAEQAHRMTQINLAVVIQKVPQLLRNRSGAEDYDSAALLLDHAAKLLLPKLPYLSGANICSCLAAFARCRYGPSDDMLQAMSSQLLDNGATKLQRCNIVSLAQLMHAQNRLVQSQGGWPLQQAVMQRVTEHLQGQLPAAPSAPHDQQQQQRQQMDEQRTANAIAQLAWLLDRSQLQTPEYLAALHRWIAAPANLEHLSALSVMQLWAAVRGQYSRHHRMTNAAAAAEQPQKPAASATSSSSAAADSGDAGADTAAAAAAVPADDDAPGAAGGSSSPADELLKRQGLLKEFFGAATLDLLAAKTAQLCSSMTERELGQVLASVSSVKYSNHELMSAAAAAFEAMCAAGTPSHETLISAAWAAAALQLPKPALLQPALVAAATNPDSINGVGVGRLLRITSCLTAEDLEQQRALLRQELHRRSGARGPAPTVPAAADGSSSSGTPEWVAALADSAAGRIGEMKPREIANVVAGLAAIPGVELHQGLLAAVASHIEVHAHTFTKFNDMEMVASAFEKMDFKAGLSALKALQQQAELMAASKF
ncbi:hypothetical protein COO60DRAFT_1703366 [Scenedesmus sp. NREL 46B-D3]|nr:hypothetical protein COO60DRAFT_1703366 [Scenedesmus sp. NREL 46B-D3]